jgi:hypothetical protein
MSLINRRIFIKGLIDSDGYEGVRNFVTYTTTSKKLSDDVGELLRCQGIAPSFRVSKPSCGMIKGRKIQGKRLAYRIGFSLGVLNGLSKRQRQGICFDKRKITAIEEIASENVYDLSVADNENFIANGFLVHNTATPVRKDELHIIANAILGPVTAKGVSKQMPCKVFYQHTGFKVKDFKQWTTFINRITKDKTRTEFIVEKVANDVERGRYIIVVTDRVAHAQTITRLLNIRDIEAVCFHGKMQNRAETMEKVKAGEVPVVVAIRKIIQRGIDVMYWDCIHITTPTANAYNYEQEVARIRTPYSDKLRELLKRDKPKPEINLYLDIGKIAFAVKGVAERVHATLRG